MKKVLIAGGNGVIGRLLAEGLRSDYEVTVLDKDHFNDTASSIQADAANYDELLKKIPKDTDVILNLLAVKIKYDVMDIAEFEKMTDVFYKASYYLCRAAAELGTEKLVFASSNHVTDVYEKDGRSLLGREITTSDYPLSKNLYGVLKLTSEQIGHLFYLENKLSVINLRIGTVVTDEMDTLHKKNGRKRHCFLIPICCRFSKPLLKPISGTALITLSLTIRAGHGPLNPLSMNLGFHHKSIQPSF